MTSANALRLELLQSAPLDKWIALSEDETRIIAIGDTFKEAADRSDAAGEPNPLILKTPASWAPLSL